MSNLTEEARDLVLEMLGLRSAKPTPEPGKSVKPTWVVITLDSGSQIGGELAYTSMRKEGSDICLTSVYEVTTTGQWKPTDWKPIAGTQCIIIGAHRYKYMQFLDSSPIDQSE